MAKVITPKKGDFHVQQLLKLLDSDLELVELPIQPEPDSNVLDCTNIVKEKVAKDGGRIVYGWQIWKTKYLVEAEFHAVWEMPDGETLKDITPKSQNYLKHILFLEDENLVYEGKQIDNVRLNITNNSLVSDFIEACKTVYRIVNKGERALLYELTYEHFTKVEWDEYIYCNMLKKNIYVMMESGYNPQSACFCNNGKKYSNCHGLNLIEQLMKVAI